MRATIVIFLFTFVNSIVMICLCPKPWKPSTNAWNKVSTFLRVHYELGEWCGFCSKCSEIICISSIIRAITQVCLDEHLLRETSSGRTRMYMDDDMDRPFTWILQLPQGLTCSQCVLQWKWHCGMLHFLEWNLCGADRELILTELVNPYHLAGSSVNSDCFWAYQSILTGLLQWWSVGKYILTHMNNQYNWLKNNTSQLYFILGRAKLCLNFSSLLRDASDIHRFPTVHMVKTHFLLENFEYQNLLSNFAFL